MVLVSSFVQDMEMPDTSCGVEEEAPIAGTASAKRDEGIRSACSIFLSASTIHGAAAKCVEPEQGIRRVQCGTEFMYQCLDMRGGFQRFDQHDIRIRREPLASRNARASSLQQCSRARKCSGRGRWCEGLTTRYRWMAMTVFCLLQVLVSTAKHRQS
jgi:hypothetical protein